MESIEFIPVILSADVNYAMPLCVTLTSLLESKNQLTKYEIFVYTECKLLSLFKDRINEFIRKYTNVQVSFIDMKDRFADAPSRLSHVTNPTYYRLLSAELLPEHYKKAIYLDVDVVVNTDLTEFFECELDDYLVGGIKHPSYYFADKNSGAYYAEVLEKCRIPDFSQYINAGVLLLNLEQIRKENYTKKFVELVKKDFPTVDQDVINSACFNKIKHLPFKYNVMPKCEMHLQNPKISEIYDINEFKAAFDNPSIIHWANPEKPWNNKNVRFSDRWEYFHSLSPIKKEDIK